MLFSYIALFSFITYAHAAAAATTATATMPSAKEPIFSIIDSTNYFPCSDANVQRMKGHQTLMAPIETLPYNDEEALKAACIPYMMEKEGYAAISVRKEDDSVFWVYADCQKEDLFFVGHSLMKLLVQAGFISLKDVKNAVFSGTIDLDAIQWCTHKDSLKPLYPTMYGSWIDGFESELECLSSLEEDVKDRKWVVEVEGRPFYILAPFIFMKEAFKEANPTFSSSKTKALHLCSLSYDDCNASLGIYDLDTINYEGKEYPLLRMEYGSWFSDLGYPNPFQTADSVLVSYILVDGYGNDDDDEKIKLWIIRRRGNGDKYFFYRSHTMIEEFGESALIAFNGIMASTNAIQHDYTLFPSLAHESPSSDVNTLSPPSEFNTPIQQQQVFFTYGRYGDWLPLNMQFEHPVLKEVSAMGVRWMVLFEGGNAVYLLTQRQMVNYVGVRKLPIMNGIIIIIADHQKPLLKELGIWYDYINIDSMAYLISYDPMGSWHFEEFRYPSIGMKLKGTIRYCAFVYAKSARLQGKRLWIVKSPRHLTDTFLLTDAEMEHLSDVHRELGRRIQIDSANTIIVAECVLSVLLERLPLSVHSSY